MEAHIEGVDPGGGTGIEIANTTKLPITVP